MTKIGDAEVYINERLNDGFPLFKGVKLRRREEAQAIVLGAVLMFGIAVTAMSVYQAAWIPAQNKEVEFKAYQKSLSDMQSFKNDMLRASSTGDAIGRTLKTGATYPSRMFFMNPPS